MKKQMIQPRRWSKTRTLQASSRLGRVGGLLLGLSLMVVGCDDGKDGGKGASSSESGRAKTAPSSVADAAKAGGDTKAVATVSPPPPPPPTVAPVPLGSRSKPPTVQEWNAQTKEVTVTGSSALGCETKLVREWLRISCRGTHPGRGRAISVSVVRAAPAKHEVFTFSKGDVASLVMPFLPGTELEAVFRFSMGTRVFRTSWPQGAPEPPAKGAFSGG